MLAGNNDSLVLMFSSAFIKQIEDNIYSHAVVSVFRIQTMIFGPDTTFEASNQVSGPQSNCMVGSFMVTTSQQVLILFYIIDFELNDHRLIQSGSSAKGLLSQGDGEPRYNIQVIFNLAYTNTPTDVINADVQL